MDTAQESVRVGGVGRLGSSVDLDVDRRKWLRRLWSVHPGQAVGQVTQQPLPDDRVDTIDSAEESAHFVGAFREAGLEFGHRIRVWTRWLDLEVLQVFDCHLQDIGFFEL